LVQSYKYVNGVSYKYVKGVSYKYIKGVSYKYVNSVCKLQVCKRCKLQIFVITKNSNSPIFVTFVRMGTWSSCTSWWTRTAGSATLAGSRVGGPLRKVVAQVFVLPKKDERPGVNVMILKYFRRKKIAKNWRFQLTTATN
jgi:hypothetical protein